MINQRQTLLPIILLVVVTWVIAAGNVHAQESVVVAVPDVNDSPDQWANTIALGSASIDTNVDPLNKPLPAKSALKTQGGSLLDSIDSKTRRSIAKMVGGLAIVVAIFVAFATLFGKRKGNSNSQSGSALEILSRSMLNKSQQMQLVRLGNRLLLIASSEHRVDTLAEIVDPQEISEIEHMLKQGDMSFFERTRQRMSGSPAVNLSRRQPIYEA